MFITKINCILLFSFILFLSTPICYAQNVQLVDGWYYMNGQKFFIKGIGYETHTRPGQVPWNYSFDPNLINYDLTRIKNAGFNTIRTWSALSEEELQLVEASGLKILFGIWIDPNGDFSDPAFITQTYNQVSQILDYSSNYNSIIGYIIMNEPQVQNIYDVGAQPLLNLWQTIINLIHSRHPGIPVSFSNTIIGDYINMNIFDFAGYNAYIYNPVTITNSHGYGGFLKYLKNNRSANKPLIVTEYGLSVSPGIPSTNYGYGGNTLEQQVSGDLLMYRELLDAGAQGNCVFQYHDGWWKGGDEFTHDPNPEEWFGLIEFSSLSDIYGSERPVWAAYEKYNKAIITNPKNGEIYNDKIPIEIFSEPEVASYTVSLNDNLVLVKSISNSYTSEELNLNFNDDLKDVDLVFNFFDLLGDTLKSETITVLYSRSSVQLPSIKINITPDSLVPGASTSLNITMKKDSLFVIEGNKIDYVMHPHIGFDPGIGNSKIISTSDTNITFVGYFTPPTETKVVTYGAGFTINFGKFKKRISDQKILIYNHWADPIASPELLTGIKTKKSLMQNFNYELDQNYPNPFNSTTVIKYSIPKEGFVTLKVYNILGEEEHIPVNEVKKTGTYEIIFNSNELPSGIYFYKLTSEEFSKTKKMILLK